MVAYLVVLLLYMKETDMSIQEQLHDFLREDPYPMHMPGHKRNPEFSMQNPYQLDVTEVEGTDNLHHPEEAIRDLMNTLKDMYGTDESYVLVGGSTCGILAAISACCQKGDRILVDRGCHRSVYHSIYLLGLKPEYLIAEQDKALGIGLGITTEQVREKLQQQKVSAVLITSPTYEGVVSDIQQIAQTAHEFGVPLIVDQAHGAHLGWWHKVDSSVVPSAICQGADVVIESLHKTLPALTQTALLHVKSSRVSARMIERYLDIYETSSPSYPLMYSVDQCIQWLQQNPDRFSKYRQQLRQFENQMDSLQVLYLWQHERKEPSKLVIATGTSEFSGIELARVLRQNYHIQVELEAEKYVLAMTTVCDTTEGILQLATALQEIDKKLFQRGMRRQQQDTPSFSFPLQGGPVRLGLYEAWNTPAKAVRLEQVVGQVAAEFGFLYPPGIPFLVPGEMITESVVEMIRLAKEKKLPLQGLEDETGKTIMCIELGA